MANGLVACGDKVVYCEGNSRKTTVHRTRINQAKRHSAFTGSGYQLQTISIRGHQLRWRSDHTDFNYGVYGLQWKAQFIPSDGLGRLHEANVILSRWPFGKSIRIQLPLREDQGALTRYFYERCCMVKAKIEIPGVSDFYAVNIHASAFATDDTKHQHIVAFQTELDNIVSNGGWFFAGGDLNTLPPGSDSTDFCMEDICPANSFIIREMILCIRMEATIPLSMSGLWGCTIIIIVQLPCRLSAKPGSLFFSYNPTGKGFWDLTIGLSFYKQPLGKRIYGN